jgi:multidrug efflux pump
VYFVWIVVTALTVPMYMFSPKELAPTEDQSVIFGIINTSANASADQKSVFGKATEKAFQSTPEQALTFQILLPPSVGATYGTDGFSGMVLTPWQDRDRTVFEVLPEVQGKLTQIPGFQIFATMPPALPGGSNFPVEFVIASTADASRLLQFARQIQAKAFESGAFFFPPIIDMKVDQPQAQLIIDRDKVAALGLNLAQVGSDVAAALGGDFVNRFNIDGYSYKVIPQIQRTARLNPEQLQDIYITGPKDQLVPLGAVARIENKVVARSLNRFQQQNSVKLSGVTNLALDDALKVMEQIARDILPSGYTVDYTGESRQLRSEGNKFLPVFSFAVLLIFLALAVQFNSFRDPLVILAGSVPLAMFGALVFTALKMPNPSTRRP